MIPLQPDGYRGSDGCGGGDGDNDGQDSCIEMQRFVGSQEGKQRQTRAVAYLHNDDDDSSRDINHKFELEDGGAGFRVGVDDGERARKVWQHGTLRGLKKEKMKKRRILTRPRDGTRGRSHRWCACRPCCDAYIRFRDWFRYPRVTLVVGSAVVFAVMVMFMVLSATVLVEKTQVPLDSQYLNATMIEIFMVDHPAKEARVLSTYEPDLDLTRTFDSVQAVAAYLQLQHSIHDRQNSHQGEGGDDVGNGNIDEDDDGDGDDNGNGNGSGNGGDQKEVPYLWLDIHAVFFAYEYDPNHPANPDTKQEHTHTHTRAPSLSHTYREAAVWTSIAFPARQFDFARAFVDQHPPDSVAALYYEPFTRGLFLSEPHLSHGDAWWGAVSVGLFSVCALAASLCALVVAVELFCLRKELHMHMHMRFDELPDTADADAEMDSEVEVEAGSDSSACMDADGVSVSRDNDYDEVEDVCEDVDAEVLSSFTITHAGEEENEVDDEEDEDEEVDDDIYNMMEA